MDEMRPSRPAPPGLTVSAAAGRLGISPDTLRSWHRRYGIGPSRHIDGRNRHYGPEDLARLELMCDALVDGASCADAARHALAASAAALARHRTAGPPTFTPWDPTPDREVARRGGRGLRLPGATTAARGLGRAVLAMDPVGVRRLLAASIADHGVVHTWDGVVRPVLAAIADRWASTGVGIEQEHLLSECLLRAFDAVGQTMSPPRNPRPVLLACVPDDLHSLPLSALAAALAERGVAGHVLGAALPEDALHAAIRRTAPAAVVLWAQYLGPGLGSGLARLPRPRLRCRFFVAGPGWSETDLPTTVARLDSLASACGPILDAAVMARR